jgi:hypothetical protein
MAAWTDCFSNVTITDPVTKVAKNVGGDVATITCLQPLFVNIVSAATALSGVALFLMIIMGGYNFLFAGGDQKKLEKAKGTLTAAIIGLVVIACAYLIIKTISTITGVTGIETFQINTQN